MAAPADDAAAHTQLVTNLDYKTTGDATKARLFVDATRYLLLTRPASVQKGDRAVQLDHSYIRDELHRAERWLSSQGELPGAGGRGVSGRRALRAWAIRGTADGTRRTA